MTNRKATIKEIRKHYKDLGYDVRINSVGAVSFRRNIDRFPGSPQMWLEAAKTDDYTVDPEYGVQAY